MKGAIKNIIIVSLVILLVCFYFIRNDSADAAYDKAYTDGFNSGYEVGYIDGRDDGYDDGYDSGYKALKPETMPENGTILSGKEYNQSQIKVTASDDPCVVAVKNTDGVERVVFFVRPNETVEIGVPREMLNVYFATGEEWYGYGKGLMFGENTVYSKDSSDLDFKQYSWEYTLYPVSSGNFSETPSTENEFF